MSRMGDFGIWLGAQKKGAIKEYDAMSGGERLEVVARWKASKEGDKEPAAADEVKRLEDWINRAVMTMTVWGGTRDDGKTYYICVWCKAEGGPKDGDIKHDITCMLWRMKTQAMNGESVYGLGCKYCGGAFSGPDLACRCGYEVG